MKEKHTAAGSHRYHAVDADIATKSGSDNLKCIVKELFFATE